MAFTDNSYDFFMSREWPGNVRQLKNFVTKAAVYQDKGNILDYDFLKELDNDLDLR